MAAKNAAEKFLADLEEAWKQVPEPIRLFAIPELLTATKMKNVEVEFNCPHCEKRIRRIVQAPHPDMVAWSRAYEMVWDRHKGKPPTAPQPTAAPQVVNEDELVERIVQRLTERRD